MELTLFQARYIEYLSERRGCTLRAIGGNFFSRYELKNGEPVFRGKSKYLGVGGNQIEGMILKDEALKTLRENNIITTMH